MTCKENVMTAITCGLEMWIKFTETSSALGGIFAMLYVQPSDTFCGSWTRTSVSSREVLFDTVDLDSPHSSHAPLQGQYRILRESEELVCFVADRYTYRRVRISPIVSGG